MAAHGRTPLPCGLSVIARRIEPDPLLKNAFARDVINLEAGADRILEQHRVISRRPRSLLGRVNDLGLLLAQESVDLVDIVPAAGAEAEMVQAHGSLNEALAFKFGIAAADPERGPP